jgi:dihydrofolate reductase
MNRLPRTVFSTTLSGDPGWNGTLARGDLPGVVARLKAEVRGDVLTFGGADIADALVALDPVDEYRPMITPNLLGEGKRPFEGGRPRLDLALVETRPLDTEAVILHHRRDRKA